MRLIRVHVACELRERRAAVLTGAAAGHVRRVLRLRTGDPVTLFNGDGWNYPGGIVPRRRSTVRTRHVDHARGVQTRVARWVRVDAEQRQ